MQYYMDEKWKLSREDDYSSSSKPSFMSRSVSQRSSCSGSSNNYSNKPSLARSFSQKNSSFRSPLSRSSSQKSTTTSSTSKSSSLSRSSSQRCADFTKKCTNLAKEQRAKFYIVKRCITMLVRWNKNGDS